MAVRVAVTWRCGRMTTKLQEGVMNTKFAYVTPQCCAHPAIATMDHIRGNDEPIVNRMCLHCGRHWYGNDGTAVVEFTRSAWDRWMSEPQKVVA